MTTTYVIIIFDHEASKYTLFLDYFKQLRRPFKKFFLGAIKKGNKSYHLFVITLCYLCVNTLCNIVIWNEVYKYVLYEKICWPKTGSNFNKDILWKKVSVMWLLVWEYASQHKFNLNRSMVLCDLKRPK